MPRGAVPLWRQLHVRVALIVVAGLVLLSAALLLIARHYSALSSLEATQRMNLGIARYIVDHQDGTLIDAQGNADRARMKALALHVMMINPSVEVYLLDREGRVLAHALEGLQGPDPVGSTVDLAPAQALLNTPVDVLRFPVLGDDPRRAGARNIISAAPIAAADAPPGVLPGAMSGYLYVVLNGQALQGVTASLANSDAQREMLIGLLLATGVAAVLLVLVLRKLTRPLRELTLQVQAFRPDAQRGSGPATGDEIEQLARATQAMRERIDEDFARLDEANRLRRELVSNISHDLRSPLASIQGYVETVLLRGNQLDEATRDQHLRTALRHINQLDRRVADLFELSKLDAGRVEPQCEVFCMAELLQDVVQSYQLAAQQCGVKLALAAGSHAQAKVRADIALIERVLQNLIDNALRHTPQDGDVTVALDAAASQIQVSVTDSGSGIAREHLPHIFERYWQASDETGTHPGASAGLGLAIVKRILDLHGSVVRVRSELARGTRIEFGLPQAG
jgi:signal transduction histidine kinase